MRTVALLLLLVATACGSATFAAEGTAEKPKAAHNSVCPVSGDTVDADTKPVVVKLRNELSSRSVCAAPTARRS